MGNRTKHGLDNEDTCLPDPAQLKTKRSKTMGETQSGSRPNTRSGNSASGSKSKNKPSPSAPSSSKLKPDKGKSPSLPKLDKVKSPLLPKPNKGKSAVPSSSKNDKKTAGEDLLKDFNDAYAQGAVPAETQLRTSHGEKQLNTQSSARKASALKSPARKGKAPAPKSPIASKTATPKDFGASFSGSIDEATSDIEDEDADIEESEQETDNNNNNNNEEEADNIADDAVPIDTMMVKDVTRPRKQKKGTRRRKHKSKAILADFANINEAEELLTLAKAVYRRETCFKNMFPATDLEHQPAYVDVVAGLPEKDRRWATFERFGDDEYYDLRIQSLTYANYANSSVRYDFDQTAWPLICAKLQLASGDNSRLVSGLLKDRVFHHDQLDLKTATSTGHPFRSDLIPEILQLVLFDKKSKTDGLILRQLNELER
ncbi:hypothetical protein BT96DRAFT_1003662, partial [Gymnopus androsaceus JB14]